MVHSKTNRKYDGLQADLRREERRKKFLAAGLEAFGTTGYTKTSIKQLCQIAGLTERYFYESFKNKEDLLCVVYQQLIDEIKNAALSIIENRKGDYNKGIFEAFETFFKWFADDPRKAKLIFFEVLGVSDRVDRVYRAAIVTLKEIIDYMMIKISPDLDINTHKNFLFTTGLAGGLLHIAHVWALDGFNIPVDKLTTQSVKMLTILRNAMMD